MTRPRLLLAALAAVAVLAASCASEDPSATPTASSTPPASTATAEATATAEVQTTPTGTPSPSPTASGTPEATATPEVTEVSTETSPPSIPSPTSTLTPPPTASPAPTSTPTIEVLDIRATRLQIPVLGIDAEVHGSREVPDTSPMPAGCPAKPPGQTTLTVPAQGIATPEETFEGLERKSWIYGHSRWQGEPGLFFSLQSLNVGDELYVDGFARADGSVVAGRRFVVDGLFLADTVSGGDLVTAEQPEATSQVILQTSVRERGTGKAWILDRDTLLQKSVNIVEGDLEDPCKYLLLFVVASAS